MNSLSDRVCDHDAAGSQPAVIAFLSSEGAHGAPDVERIDTHASVLFLVGDRAWKLKRAVRYDYLDYSSCERRRLMCEAEFRLGRRLAPELYRRVVPVTQDASGTLSIAGAGTPVDWLIEMVRFDQEQLLDRLAGRGALDRGVMPALADAVVHLHGGAERLIDRGGHAGMAWVIEGNAAAFVSDRTGALNPAVGAEVTAAARNTNDRLRARLDARRDGGFVRRCHGDLHLGNIVLVDGRPTLFDPIEFNDAIACIDVMYDLAFLLMDFERLSMSDHANLLLNVYLNATGDFGGLAALPLFLSCRAAVRAKTSATTAAVQVDPDRRASSIAAAAAYLDLARQLIHPPPPVVVAIGGYSGTGKSSLARGLAAHVGPTPGAVVIRSDEIRKRMFGLDPLAPLASDAYSAEVSTRVYKAAVAQAQTVVATGHGAIVDAVFLQREWRDAIERTAAAAGVRFVGLWLDAPEDVLIERVAARRQDASDATIEVIRGQRRAGAGRMTWHRVDASQPVDRVFDLARRLAARDVEDAGTMGADA